MNLILFDDEQVKSLYPLTASRPAAEIRAGIKTISQKWKDALQPEAVYYDTLDYLAAKYPNTSDKVNSIRINGRLLPANSLVSVIKNLLPGDVLVKGQVVLAINGAESINQLEFVEEVDMIDNLWDIFSGNHKRIEADFEQITKGRNSEVVDETCKIIGNHPVFLEPGAKCYASVLNTTDGPIYLDKDSEIMEGCLVRGPFSLGEHSQLKMGARIYSGTTVGPHSKVGGEVNNSVIFGFSNKGHEGFLGNSVVGEWCNIGADSNNSNLKNNYDEVKLWSYVTERFVKTGLQFCGLIMADHSKCGINTMFNTGTVVGFSANVFGSGFPRNFVPDFGWGGASGFVTYKPEAAILTAERVMARRGLSFSAADKMIFEAIYDNTSALRIWEKNTNN